MSRTARQPGAARPYLGSFIGMGGLACVLFLVLASLLAAPWWSVLVLTLVWAVLFWLGTRWFMAHPGRVAALPAVMLVIWFVVVFGGAFLLGWKR